MMQPSMDGTINQKQQESIKMELSVEPIIQLKLEPLDGASEYIGTFGNIKKEPLNLHNLTLKTITEEPHWNRYHQWNCFNHL